MTETVAALRAEAVEAMWKLGNVVEDRWGLRWRADYVSGLPGKRWCCRSVGLRIHRGHEAMAERGPLTFVRQDRVFAGEDATAARKMSEEDDRAVTVDGDDAENASDEVQPV